MKKTIIFYLLCLITICFFASGVSKVIKYNNPVPVLPPIYNIMNVIIETKLNNNDDIVLKANDKYLSMPYSGNLFNRELDGKIKNLDIFIKDGFKEKIKRVIIFNDLKMYYSNDFSDFEKKQVRLCLKNNCQNYVQYTIPSSLKFNNDADSYNFRTKLHAFCISLLSLFRFQIPYFIPYILLFFTIFYFINSKEEIKYPKFSLHVLSFLILALGVILRFNGLFDYFPWADEYWSVQFSDPKSGFLNSFADPGNPPFFYLMLKAWFFVFGISNITMKIFPFLFGVLSVISVWCFLKKEFNIKTAVIGAFLTSINISLIYYSSETRSYIVQAFLTPVIVYYFFKTIKEEKTKNFFIYGILIAIAVNLHYYEVLFIFSNFLYGLFYLICNKKKKIKFIITNLTGGLFFLPYFCYTSFQKAILDASFNTWIPDINIMQIKKCILYLFGGWISFILSAVFFIKTALLNDSKEKEFIMYLLYTIFMVISGGIIFSYIIRPILVGKYLILLFPLFIMFLSVIFSYSKIKYGMILFIFWTISISGLSDFKNNKRKGIIDMPIAMAYEYNKEKSKNENLYVILNSSQNEYLNAHKRYMLDNVQYISKSVREAEETIKQILKKDKNAVIFTSVLNPNTENFQNKEKYTCYFNSASDLCLWRIQND